MSSEPLQEALIVGDDNELKVRLSTSLADDPGLYEPSTRFRGSPLTQQAPPPEH